MQQKVKSTLKVERDIHLHADISSHIKYAYLVGSIIYREVFKAAHVIHIARIKKIVAYDIYMAKHMAFRHNFSADACIKQRVSGSGRLTRGVFKRR